MPLVLEALAESLGENRPVARLPIGVHAHRTATRMMVGQGVEALFDRLSRTAAPHAVLLLPPHLARAVLLGKPAPTGQSRRLEVDEEEALALDQDRHRHWLQPPRVLEGLPLVALKHSAQSAALACERKALKMEVTAVTAQELESVRDRLA